MRSVIVLDYSTQIAHDIKIKEDTFSKTEQKLKVSENREIDEGEVIWDILEKEFGFRDSEVEYMWSTDVKIEILEAEI